MRREREPLLARFVRSPNHRRIITNTAWLFIDKVAYAAIGVAVGVWVARYLQPASFGLYSYALAIVGFLTPLASLGLQRIVVRDLIREPSARNEILGTTLKLRLGVSAVIVATLVGAAATGVGPQDRLLRWLIALISFQLIFNAIGETVSCWFESQLESGYILIARNSAAVLAGALKVVLILASAQLIAFGAASVFQIAVFACVSLALYRWSGNRLSPFSGGVSRARRMVADSWPLMLSGLAIVTYMRVDQIMLGLLASNEELGVYSVAVRLSELWYFIPSAVAASLFPAIIQSRENQEPRVYQRRMQAFFDMMTGMAFIIALPLALIATPLVIVLFGPEYADAGSILRIHIWALVFVSLGAARGRWLIAENLAGLLLFATVLGSVVNLGLNALLIPRFGGTGAAWATLASQVASAYLSNLLYPTMRDAFRLSTLALLVPVRPRLLLTSLRDIAFGQR